MTAIPAKLEGIKVTLKIMTKLELVRKLREIASQKGCKLTIRAAIAIAEWFKQES